VAKLIGERGQGGNISVTNEGCRPVVYTNRSLDDQQRKKLVDEGYLLAYNSTERERTRNWGQPEGLRRGTYPLPFHSEMQRVDRAPWTLRYAGNIYHACVQCMAAYHALGIAAGPTGGFRGTHASKVPSVIPPTVRANSVYLRHYLGATVWTQVSAVVHRFIEVTGTPTPDQAELAEVGARLRAVFDLLDNVERMNTTFYEKVGVPGPQATY
jgi:hypothetical protein